MANDVNPIDLREARKAETEARILEAASRLFVRQGYAGTTLAQVAVDAGVAARTVYVRFATKAALLLRTIDVALVGDTEPVPISDRAWFQGSLAAPTATERIALATRGTRQVFERAGPLLVVATQAEGAEPAIAAAAQAGRRATLDNFRKFWLAMRDDDLLPRDTDLEWLIATAALLGSADTYVQLVRLHDWDIDTYENWLRTTWSRLSATGTPPQASHPTTDG